MWGAIALELVVDQAGDFPQWRVDCVFPGSAGEVRVPAAALAPIEAGYGSGVIRLSSRAEVYVVAGDHEVAIAAETTSAFASIRFE